jgi:hypothetical protein
MRINLGRADLTTMVGDCMVVWSCSALFAERYFLFRLVEAGTQAKWAVFCVLWGRKIEKR